jgi:hypothetical protein
MCELEHIAKWTEVGSLYIWLLPIWRTAYTILNCTLTVYIRTPSAAQSVRSQMTKQLQNNLTQKLQPFLKGAQFSTFIAKIEYKVVQIWPGLFVCKQVTVCPGHIWTTLYFTAVFLKLIFFWNVTCRCANRSRQLEESYPFSITLP